MRALSWRVALALTALAPAAAAQEAPEETARRELIAQSELASSAADHARALELARRAASIRPSPSLTCFLAREHRALGQLVEALDLARACVRAADADAALRNRDTIRQACEAVRASVEPRLGRVEVSVVGDAPDGLVVRLGGRAVLPELRGVALPVMPGGVRVEAEAPGFLRVVREGPVAAGETLRVELTLEREPPPVLTPAPAPQPVVVAVPTSAPPPTPAPRARRPVGVGPWLLAGAGAATMVFAGVSYGLADVASSDRDRECFEAGCHPGSQDHNARYLDWLATTNAALVTGGVLLAGAVVWYVAARIAGRAEAPPRPTVTARQPGLGLAF